MSSTCEKCAGTQWTAKGLCWKCDSRPTLKHNVTAVMDALTRPDGFDPSHLAMLSPAARCRLERMTAETRLRKIELELESLSRQRGAINSMAWTERSNELLRTIREADERLEAEHLALRQIIALPDAELIEMLAEIEPTADEIADEVLG